MNFKDISKYAPYTRSIALIAWCLGGMNIEFLWRHLYINVLFEHELNFFWIAWLMHPHLLAVYVIHKQAEPLKLTPDDKRFAKKYYAGMMLLGLLSLLWFKDQRDKHLIYFTGVTANLFFMVIGPYFIQKQQKIFMKEPKKEKK